jgi:hypothetical protein
MSNEQVTKQKINVEGISNVIAVDFNDRLWDLKADIFEAMKKLGAVSEFAEGPDYEEEIEEVVKAAWGKM